MVLLGIGLMTGWPFIKWVVNGTWKTSFVAAFIVNSISTSALYLFLYLAEALDLDHSRFFKVLSGTLFSKALSCFFALFLVTLIEVIALTLFCESEFYQREGLKPPSSTLKVWLGLGAANAISLVLAYLI